MTLFTRFIRLFKADVHGVMDQMEDKTLLLRQYLREMETSLGQKEGQVAALGERIERMSAQVVRHSEEMEKLESDLNLALAKEKDDIARLLIRRRRTIERTVGHIKIQLETLNRDRSRLIETLADQKLTYESLKSRADAWHQRTTDDEPFASAAQTFAPDTSAPTVHDEEIELELIRRKEALQNGGAA